MNIPENVNKVFPTYWDFGKGEEINDLIHSEHRALRYFNIHNVRQYSRALLDIEERQKISPAFRAFTFGMTQRILWSIAFYDETAELNQAIAQLKNGH